MKLLYWHPVKGPVVADVPLRKAVRCLAMVLEDMENRSVRFPAGARVRIVGFSPQNGWVVETPTRCPCCGTFARMSHIRWNKLLIEGPPPVKPTARQLEAAFRMGGWGARATMERAWKRDGIEGAIGGRDEP